MRTVLMGLVFVMAAIPAEAQLDRIMKGIDKAQRIKGELSLSDTDERALGEAVSQKVRTEFGVLQDRDVTKYVTLVGTVMTRASSRPHLRWEFIVLDTDGVNAFASPGGIVHITRGALGLIKSEAELAGVLAHEIAHITKKHTVKAIRNDKAFKMASEAVPGTREYVGALANAAYDNIVEKGFDRGDEEDADEEGLRLANKVGYNPSGLGTFLTKLAERNRGVATRNALFASHPETQGRIGRMTRQIRSERLAAAATVQSRYSSAIRFNAKRIADISAVPDGTRGLAEGSGKTDDSAKKKKGFGLGALKLSSGKQAESTQASASAGNRAVGVDRHATGGDNPSKVSVTVTAAEVEAFKKGIAG